MDTIDFADQSQDDRSDSQEGPEPAVLRELFSFYHLVRRLGVGRCGTAYVVIDKFSYALARETTRPAKINVARLLRVAKVRHASIPESHTRWEVDVMRRDLWIGPWPVLQCPHPIFDLPDATSQVRTYKDSSDFFTTSYNGVSLESLLQHNPIFPLGFVWHIACHLLRTVSFMHYGVCEPYSERGPVRTGPETICHRDISTRNITLERHGRGVIPILIDWGSATLSEHHRENCPEYNDKYDMRSDCLAVADVLHTMLHGVPQQGAQALDDETGHCVCSADHLAKPNIAKTLLRAQVEHFLEHFVRPLFLGPTAHSGYSAERGLNELYEPFHLFGDAFRRVKKTSSLPQKFKAVYEKLVVSEREAFAVAEADFLTVQAPMTRLRRRKRVRDGLNEEELADGLPAKRRRGRDPHI